MTTGRALLLVLAAALAACGSPDHDTAVPDAWARLSICLAADAKVAAPLPVLRRAALQAATDRATGAEAWPTRCDAHLDALQKALDAAPEDSFVSLRVAAKPSSPLWSARPAGLPPHLDATALRALFAAGAALDPGSAPGVAGPALAAPVDSEQALAIHADELAGESVPAGDLHLVTAHELCTVQAATPDRMTCQGLADAVRPHGARTILLLGSDDGEASPLVQVWNDSLAGEAGIFDAFTGARANVPEGTYSAVRVGRGITTLSLAHGVVSLAGTALAGPDAPVPPPRPLPGVGPVPSPADPAAPVLLGDAVLWLARGHLYARHLRGAVAPVDVGVSPVDALSASMRGCRAGPLTAIDLGNSSFVLHARGNWIVVGDTTTATPTFGARLSCDPSGVSAVEVVARESDHAHVAVDELRCTTSGCTRTRVELGDLGPRHLSDAPVAVRLGQKILLAFRRAAPVAADAGVRLRLAPLDELARAPEVVVFDPGAFDPSAMDDNLQQVRLDVRARGNHAWLLVHRNGEWIPIHVDPDGTFGPVGPAR